jgi:hypothetical protein
MSETYTPPTFNQDNIQGWKSYLDKKGYVVLRDILTFENKENYLEIFKREWCQVANGFSWDDSSTWTSKNLPLMLSKGMAVYSGWGHSEFMWSLRTDPNIYGIFEKLFDTNNLVCSFDGFSAFFDSKIQKSPSWLHVDQNPKTLIESYQGAYNFLKVGEHDAGFVVVPESHNTYTPNVSHKKNWIVVDQDTFKSDAKKLLIPENCFVIWNSKVIHANEGMKKGSKGFNRLTAYITYLPKELRSEDIKQKRIEAYKNAETTSHWANKCEIKRYPYGFGPNYEKKNFKKIQSRLDSNGEIPKFRCKFI